MAEAGKATESDELKKAVASELEIEDPNKSVAQLLEDEDETGNTDDNSDGD